VGNDQGGASGPPQPAPELAPIEVDIDGLQDFRAFLGRELDANLRPGAQHVAFDHLMGPGFGRDVVGVPVADARQRYLQALEASTANLAQYVETAEILIEAIRQVTARYEAADLRSEQVSRALHLKIQQIADARRITALSETRREYHRGQPDRPLTEEGAA
jgi:hypothetical protein